MKTFDITLDLPFEVPQTDRAGELIRMFGLTPDCIHQQHLTHTCRIDVHPGDIVYITGASGAGKTVLLHAMYDQIPPDNRLRLDDIPLHDDRPLIDCFERPVLSTTELLSRAGLSDVFSLLQSPAALSAGQQYRYRMARAMTHPAGFIFADEFTGTLDRITAAATAFKLRKVSRNAKKVFILASCHEDILRDLQPDMLIVKDLNGRTKTVCRQRNCRPHSKHVWCGRNPLATIDEYLAVSRGNVRS